MPMPVPESAAAAGEGEERLAPTSPAWALGVEASSPAPEWAAAGVHVGSVSVHDTYSAAMPLVADFGYMTDDEWAAFQISVGLHKLNVVS
jgi:hypothetical protein